MFVGIFGLSIFPFVVLGSCVLCSNAFNRYDKTDKKHSIDIDANK